MPPPLISWGGLAGRNPRSRPEMTTRKSGTVKTHYPFSCTSSLILVKKCDDPDETLGADSYLSDTACVPVATSPRPPLAVIRPLGKKVSKTHPIFRPNCLVVSRGILRFPGLLSGGRAPNALRARAPIFLSCLYDGERACRNTNLFLCAFFGAVLLRPPHRGISWKKSNFLISDKSLLFFSPIGSCDLRGWRHIRPANG